MDKKKIVILTGGRTGSSLLVHSLGWHPELNKDCGEPFCRLPSGYLRYHDFIRANFDIDPLAWQITDIPKLANLTYLNEIFKNNDVIKILYEHIEKGSPCILDFLKARDDCLFVILCRQNMLDSLVSVGFLTQHINGKIEKQVNLDYQASQWAISKWLAWERTVSKIFENRSIKIWYEELIDNWDQTCRYIQESANLPVYQLPMAIDKFERPRGKNCIANMNVVHKLKNLFNSDIINTDDYQ